MIDISKQTVKLNCPKCKKEISVSLKQVANEESVKCACGHGIQLKDNNGTNRKAINDINRSFKDLEKTIKNMGK